ncbi:MAG TPA: CopD family protein [Gaiellaceae bacterium]
MKRLALIAAVGAALALPSAAWAHAVLLRTVPLASKVLTHSPVSVQLRYSEPIEPRFAIVSVTDAAGHLVTKGSPQRSPQDPDIIFIPLKRVSEGWYLVYWRVISADGHPVRGAFTFALGPNPGPAPQFVIPSISETAATPRLVIARWIVFLSLMAAIGLFVLRILIARPLVKLRWVSVAFFVAAGATLVATPIYVALATAQFTLRSVFDLGAIVPLMRSSAFGRGFLDLWLCVALLVVAGAVAIWLDRPERPRRSLGAILALTGSLLAAGAALLTVSVSGHAGQTSPRGLSIPVDWLHFAAGSIWIGGLIGLLVVAATLGVPGLVRSVPRFSNVAFVSVMALIGSGIGNSLFHLPTLSSLWQTSYGKMVLIKIIVLATAMFVASFNLLRNKPRLAAADKRPELAPGAASLLRRLVSVEVVLVAGVIFCAALLTSLAPPASALAEVGKARAKLGPGPGTRVVNENGYRLELRIAPNRAAVPNDFSVKITKDGKPATDLRVTTSFSMLDMEMGTQSYEFKQTAPGVYSRSAPALVMVGHWGIAFQVEPPGKAPFTVTVIDKAGG